MDSEVQLVPPTRLGVILNNKRQNSGQSLAEVAQNSNGRFNVAALEKIERGRSHLSEQDIKQLASMYGLESSQIVPARSRLVVDLDGGNLSANGNSVDVKTGNVDNVLEQYLALLYILRDLDPGTELTLRHPDLVALEEALQLEVAELEERLYELMTSPEVDSRTGLLLRRIIIPSAGLLVGLTAIGSLVLLRNNSGEEAIATPSEAAFKIASESPSATNLITTTQKDTTTSSSAPATVSTVPVEIATTSTHAPDPTARATTTSTKKQTTTRPTSAPTHVPLQTPKPTMPPPPPPGPAPVVTAPPPAANQYEQLGRQAEAIINYDFRSKLSGWTIVYRGDRPGYRGLTFTSAKRIEIYVDPGDTPSRLAQVVAHEVGHAIDVTYLDYGKRKSWLSARSMPEVWWPGDGLSDFHVGAGDFAEAVAAVLVNSPSKAKHGPFTQAQLNLARQYLP